jgi:hypothetical protein
MSSSARTPRAPSRPRTRESWISSAGTCAPTSTGLRWRTSSTRHSSIERPPPEHRPARRDGCRRRSPPTHSGRTPSTRLWPADHPAWQGRVNARVGDLVFPWAADLRAGVSAATSSHGIRPSVSLCRNEVRCPAGPAAAGAEGRNREARVRPGRLPRRGFDVLCPGRRFWSTRSGKFALPDW